MNEPNSMLSRMFSPAGEYNCNNIVLTIQHAHEQLICKTTVLDFLSNLSPSFTMGAPYSKFGDEYILRLGQVRKLGLF